MDDLRVVAPMALRLRRSQFIEQYFEVQNQEEEEIATALAALPTDGDGEDEPGI